MLVVMWPVPVGYRYHVQISPCAALVRLHKLVQGGFIQQQSLPALSIQMQSEKLGGGGGEVPNCVSPALSNQREYCYTALLWFPPPPPTVGWWQLDRTSSSLLAKFILILSTFFGLFLPMLLQLCQCALVEVTFTMFTKQLSSWKTTRAPNFFSFYDIGWALAIL